MLILGIDPGTTRIGYGVISYDRGKFKYLDCGILENQGSGDFLDMTRIRKELKKIISKYKPQISAVEKLFFFKNQKTIMSVSQVRGVILLTLQECGVKICEFTPLQVKQGVSTYGRAGKDQVGGMVRIILELKDEIKSDDAADALAIAICCANNYSVLKLS